MHLLKIHLPFHESDHVLNFAYNALCEGTCLQDLGLRRNDDVFLDALGARRIPDPTTAGDFAGIKPRTNGETGVEEPWELKDLRKTCATFYDEHLPESSIEILDHSLGGITYRHYGHRAPLAFKAIMTIPHPTAFWELLNWHEGECPCCRRGFADA